MPENLTTKLDRKVIIGHLELLGQLFSYHADKKDWPGFECGLNKAEYDDIETLIRQAYIHNNWFTDEQVRHTFRSWGQVLTAERLTEWTSAYPFAADASKKVGLIMAGNIPMVGLHDIISVLISGHSLILRPSSDDHILIRMIGALLGKLDERYDSIIHWADGQMKGFDAVIATGSNNTARYFEYYFSKVPHIIRKNRSAIAIMDGTETPEEMTAFSEDVLRYFGLGCRNVAKIYIPRDFDLDLVFGGLYEQREVINHNKYANNYDYHKSIFLLNGDDILENGFLLMKESMAISSPVATLLYERFDDMDEVRAQLKERAEEIQCIVSHQDVPFGQAQRPDLADYADGVDIMAFLANL